MALPKRPSGGTAPQKVVPPEFGEPQNEAKIEPEQDFALPELEDFTLPDLEIESEVAVNKTSSIPKNVARKLAAPDSPRNRFDNPSSTNQADPEPSKIAASDVLDAHEDEDELTALDRELGLLDDDDYPPVRVEGSDPIVELPLVESDAEVISGNEDLFAELEENLEEDDDSDDEFADLLKGLEDATSQSTDDDDALEDDDESPAPVDSIDSDWEAALSELESFNEDAALPVVSDEDDDSDDDDEDEEDEEEWQIEEFTPPANPFALPEDFESLENSEDEDEEDEEDEDLPDDDFVPPSDPFANPFASASSEEAENSSDDDAGLEEETAEEETEAPNTSLKDKAAGLLSPTKAKQGLSNYFAKLKAELDGEKVPTSRNRPTDNEPESDTQNDELEESGSPEEGRTKSPIRIFGFLRPIKSLYTTIVNIIFGIITAILGILSKLPLIGFIFKIALEATKVLRAIAQYIPLAFFIGILVAVSYFSVPRDSLIGLPDSGGATFTEFSYDPASNSASGVIFNTGDIIADVEPVFTIKSIQPGPNPVSWVIPAIATTCVADAVQVDIDSTINVTATCSEAVTGFIPRATGELK